MPDPATERAIREFLGRIAGRYDVAEAILYGSRARGDFKPHSDADVALILRGQKGNRVSVIIDMAGTEFDVLMDTGILVQAMPFWQEEWEHPERLPNPWLLRNIQREGVPL
jgi:predicted nucleotidyltransferase